MRRRLFGLCWILALAALLGGCTQASTPLPSPSRTVDYAAMETAIEDKISSGSLSLSTINAVLVSVGGETRVAHYRNGAKPEDALHVWSVTKSVVSALIGIAIDEKIISGLDATLLELLPRYQKYLTAEEKSITLRQLMSMTAGFPPDDPAPFENIHSVFKQRSDPIPMILKDGLEVPPGHIFSYSSRSAHLVSAVLREALVRADGERPPQRSRIRAGEAF
jgi:CubicO group peptidase (beta-lactamase class C family)